MDTLSSDFKERAIHIIDECLVKFKEFKGKLPFKVEDLEKAKNEYLMHMDGDCIMDLFIDNSSDSWDNIKDRNEKLLISAFKTKVEEQSVVVAAPGGNPLVDMIHNVMAGMKAKILASLVPWLEFILENRKVLFDEAFENHLWDDVGELVKIAIKYAHLKRDPKLKNGVLKYTNKYAPKLSVKEHAAKWEVKLV